MVVVRRLHRHRRRRFFSIPYTPLSHALTLTSTSTLAAAAFGDGPLRAASAEARRRGAQDRLQVPQVGLPEKILRVF